MSGFKMYEIDSLLRDAVDAAMENVNSDTGEMSEDNVSIQIR